MGGKWSHNKLILAQIKQMEPKVLYAQLLWECNNKGHRRGWIWYKFVEFKSVEEWPGPLSIEPKAPDQNLREGLGINKKRWKAKKWREKLKQSLASRSAFAAAGSRDAGAHET